MLDLPPPVVPETLEGMKMLVVDITAAELGAWRNLGRPATPFVAESMPELVYLITQRDPPSVTSKRTSVRANGHR